MTNQLMVVRKTQSQSFHRFWQLVLLLVFVPLQLLFLSTHTQQGEQQHRKRNAGFAHAFQPERPKKSKSRPFTSRRATVATTLSKKITASMTVSVESENDVQRQLSGTANTVQTRQKQLICIRHAMSLGNEFMSKPGNQWGDDSFCDDATLTDVSLSETGMRQVATQLLPEMRSLLTEKFEDDVACPPKMPKVDLIVCSPMRRCLQTFQYGVLPAFLEQQQQTMPPIVALPLCTERVYTASDTGSALPSLEKEFPFVDWTLWEGSSDQWWFTLDQDNTSDSDLNPVYTEWRPSDGNQWYAVPGEPQEIFERRMDCLLQWLRNRPEANILMVSHWGVIRHLSGQSNIANCEVKFIPLDS